MMATEQAAGQAVEDGALVRCVSCDVPVWVPAWALRVAVVKGEPRSLCRHCANEHRRQGQQ